ncbi:MAG: OadG family protein [Clostridia bacterium]|nr:OadG family protein [Clostridia bacterium]
MVEYFASSSASLIEKGLFIMLVGIAGVFSVLIVFFLLIKLLERVFPVKAEEEQSCEE